MLLDFSKYEHPEKYSTATCEFDWQVLKRLEKWYNNDFFSVTTSGSTGMPKTISHSKTAMQNSARLTGDYFHFQQGQSTLLCLPVDKIGGLMMLVRAILFKLKLYTLPPKRLLDLEALPPLDFAPLLPMQAMENFKKLDKIKTILLGGAEISKDFWLKIKQHPSKFFHSYGMSETISHIGLCNLQKSFNEFEVLPSIQISINNESELKIEAPKLEVQNLQTTDIVEMLSENTFRFIGRSDSIINSGGLKLIAEEIEKQLTQFIAEPFYIGKTLDSLLGEKVTLFIEDKTWDKDKFSTLKQNLQTITPKQAIPKAIVFKEKFTYTPTGKIKR